MDPQQLLKSRRRAVESVSGPHALRHKGDLCVLHTKSAEVDDAGVDTGKLLVPCTITTQDEDRERDVIVTAGILCDYHKMNPVVLLDHGWPTGGTMYPAVARADDESGQYQVTLEAGKARSVSRFTSKVADSYQTFALVAEGLLKGVSIGFRILKAEYRKDHPDDYQGWPGLLIAQSELVEYSHCAVGVNPYALADKIGKGFLGAERLSANVWKALAPLLPEIKPLAHGFEPAPDNPVESKSMAQNEAADPTPAPETKAPAAATPTPTPAPETKAPEAPVKKADGMNETEGGDGGNMVPPETRAEDGTGTEADDPMKDWLPGAQVLAGCHALLMQAGDHVQSGYSKQENERVMQTLDALTDGINTLAEDVVTCFSECYPDYDLPGKAKSDGEGEGNEGNEYEESEEAEEQKARLHARAVLSESGRLLAKRLAEYRKSLKAKSGQARKADPDEALRQENTQLREALKRQVAEHEELQKLVRRKLRGAR